MRDCPTLACSPPENVPCTSPKFGSPSSFAKSVSSPTSEPPVSMKKVTSSPPFTRTLTTGSGPVLDEFQARDLPVAVQFIGRLALEALQLGDVQGRILLDDQLVGGDIDAVE